MSGFALTAALVTGLCIAAFSLVLVAGAIYGVLVWYPARQRKRVASLKASGRQGEATILDIQEGERPSYVRRAVFIRTPIRLEIRVPGFDAYEVNKSFNIPSHLIDQLRKGDVVPVWVDPNEPLNLDKIVIHIKE